MKVGNFSTMKYALFTSILHYFLLLERIPMIIISEIESSSQQQRQLIIHADTIEFIDFTVITDVRV